MDSIEAGGYGRTTIKDVALKSGYSITTVSMVLNNKEVSIPQSTRDKVWAVAKSLNYRPNSLAVSLITKRTQILGLILPNNCNPLFATLSLGIEKEARKAGYALIYGNSDNAAGRDRDYLEAFLDRQVDGILMISSCINEHETFPILELLNNCPVPIVAVDRKIPGSDIPVIQMNHEKAGYLATMHLLQSGHRRIACCISPGFLSSRIERVRGYQGALESFGIKADKELLFEIPFTAGADGRVLEKMLQQNVTAVVAVNDTMALEFYRYARHKGIRIPEDLSVIGSDDSSFADMLSPALTTIRQPAEEIARAAVSTLLTMIQEQTNAAQPQQQFDAELIIRESSISYNGGS